MLIAIRPRAPRTHDARMPDATLYKLWETIRNSLRRRAGSHGAFADFLEAEAQRERVEQMRLDAIEAGNVTDIWDFAEKRAR